MTKQEMIKQIDEEIIRYCQSIIRCNIYPKDEKSLYLT